MEAPSHAWDTAALVATDRSHLWHPFTPMREWCAPDFEPLVIVSGDGAILRDSRGREYLDGNSSIWTNLHGHNHPRLNAAITEQLGAIAHCSFLGQSHPAAVRLAEALVALFPPATLTRVFYSDNGSTAVEVALRMAREFWQHRGEPRRRRFLAFSNAYHGDTLGAASLGGIAVFRGLEEGVEPLQITRVRDIEALRELPAEIIAETAAAVIEPLVQGAAGMRLWPAGTLATLRAWCDEHGVLLIADEELMFACEQEAVLPDFLCLAKGLTGGYLPLAATLTTERVFAAFLGEPGERRALYYGHSYTGSALGCAAALANLEIFREEKTLAAVQPKIRLLGELLHTQLAPLPRVAEIRQRGFIVGVELMADPATGRPYPPEALIGARVCHAARAHGLLTRPIHDTLVLMPPYCVSEAQLERAVGALRSAIEEITRAT